MVASLFDNSLGGEIDLSLAEISSLDFVLEKDINLSKRAVLRLRKAEIGPDQAEPHPATIEEARHGAPVPGGLLNHVRNELAINQAEGIVRSSREHDTLGAEIVGGNLRDNSIYDGADGNKKDKVLDQENAANGVGETGVVESTRDAQKPNEKGC